VTSAKVGAVGFCMGGGFVLQLAAQQGDKIGAAVPFYGVGPGVPQEYSGISAPIQGHYAEEDGFYPVDQAREQEQALRDQTQSDVEFFYYPAGHAFHNDKDHMGTYNEQAAAQAWQRTVEFLKANLT
jgi:carboxymethylenebutenolidase